jgi:hypothetical protein
MQREKDSKENDENESDSNTPGGQLGHPGKTLDFLKIPIMLLISRLTMPSYKTDTYIRVAGIQTSI